MIAESLYPINRFPGKFQIAQMLRVAHQTGFSLTEEDIEFFGIERKTLAHGHVELGIPATGWYKSLDQLRKRVPDVWKRMTPFQKQIFFLSYVSPAKRYLIEILQMLGETGVETEGDQQEISKLVDSLISKVSTNCVWGRTE